MVWERNNKIYYSDIYFTGSGQNQSWYICTPNNEISAGDGYTFNTNPSIIDYVPQSYTVGKNIVVWIGSRKEINEEDEKYLVYRTIVKDLSNGAFGVYGENVGSVGINKNSTANHLYWRMLDDNYAIVWNNIGGTLSSYITSYGTIDNILINGSPLVGKNIQLSNGSSFEDMKACLLGTQSGLPYSIKLSNNILREIYKNENYTMQYGREGVVYSNSAEFYFAIGDIVVDGKTIEFEKIPDIIQTYSQLQLNKYLVTTPFALSDKSKFEYNIQFGINDSLECFQALKDGDKINFKIQLIDYNTNSIIGEYDNITYSSNFVSQYSNIGYSVNTEGMGSKIVRLKLIVNAFNDAMFSLSDRKNKENVIGLNKIGNRKNINYKGSLAVTEYALEQNFPNPFNPTTTIKYQIPNDGNVTMKIFDNLGREVATLVNEYKTNGRYEVTFDGSKLSSGIYYYSLKAGKYQAVKKLLLLK